MTNPQDRLKGEHVLEMLSVMVSDEATRILGVDQAQAELLGDEVATRFSAQFGGEFTYLPQGRVFTKAKLHRMIWEAFTGTNQAELGRRFHVSTVHIYRVLARQRERERNERQAGLFTAPATPSPGVESPP